MTNIMTDIAFWQTPLITPLVIALVIICTAVLMLIMLVKLSNSKAKIVALETVFNDSKKRVRKLENRFSGIINIDAELKYLNASKTDVEKSIECVKADYREKKKLYNRLKLELAVYDDKLSFAELGVYEPHFDFQDSENYKKAIKEVRDKQKDMISAKTAVTCTTEWEVQGSAAKGRTMIARNIRLTLRAFNNECDAAIANTRWNNANAMEKRIGNARTQINKMNESNHIVIALAYINLKFKELRLTHEYRERLKIEKDERAEASRLAREEAKLLKDADVTQKKENEYQALLEQARKEAGLAGKDEMEAAKLRVADLEKQLATARDKNERAQAMASKTRSGYVYVISNVGSFGENIIKIGMTRRLEPYDRVRELGDASVPFVFDVHAMIYSDDAPALEKALHAEYETRRVNMANHRKEFFRISADEVEQTVRQLVPDADFFKDIEAREFRETVAKRKEEHTEIEGRENNNYPDEI